MSVGITLTPTFTMKQFDPNYLLTLSKLAVTFHEQGKTDEAIALIYQLIEECYPHILERSKTDKTVIYKKNKSYRIFTWRKISYAICIKKYC